MSASLTVRRCVSSESPTASSSKCLRNGWTSPSLQRRAANVFAGHRRQHRRRALHRRALQEVLDGADAAELLAAAGAARAAVLEHRQRRAVAGRLGRGVAIEDEQAAVPRRHLRDRLRRDLRIVGDERRDQAAAAARGERERLVEVVVRHQRRDRAERLDVVDRVVLHAVAAEHERRREEGAVGDALAFRREAVARRRRRSRCPRRAARARSPTSACCAFEASAPIFTPSTAGSPTLTLARRSRSRAAIASRCRRGTIARRIAVHFWPALTVISRATSLAKRSNSSSSGRHVGAEDGGVERIGLGVERDRARQQVGVAAQLQRRVGRAGEGDDVAAARAGRAGRRSSRSRAAGCPPAAGPSPSSSAPAPR